MNSRSIGVNAGEGRQHPVIEHLFWVPIAVGLLSLWVPTLVDLIQGIWSDDEQAHGPIVLSVSLWLLYRKWPELRALQPRPGASAIGLAVTALSLMLYALGRSQAVVQIEVGALILLLIGLTLTLYQVAGLKILWFPFFFMLFMIPLPGVFVQTLTIPLKTAVSYAAEVVLYAVGYPIARSGVILSVGPYQLLVADACAGMHTLFTLEALGLLYMNLVGHQAIGRNVTLALLIFPISFCANVIRVIALIMITFHLGDAAGQGFLHGFAGMVLFLTALLLIIGVDSILERLFPKSR